MVQRYYSVVSSLPYLPHFTRADHLPVTELQVQQRLTALLPEDYADLKRAWSLIGWKRSPNVDVIEQYADVMRLTQNQALREIVAYRVDQRVALVALRRQQRGLGPTDDDTWAVGRWARWFESHWSDPNLRLTHVYPWIPQARGFLANGDALSLERLLMDQVWTRLSRLADAHPFGFEQVFAFFFKWDILKRWLSYDATVAQTRFSELVEEVIGEHRRIFDN